MDIKLVKQRFCDYSIYIRGNSPSTIKRYNIVIDFFAKAESVGDISEVSKEKILSFFYNGRIDRKWQPATFISYYNTLSVFFQWCIKEEILEKDYTAELEKPRLTKRFPVKLSQSEALRLLEYVYNYPYQSEFLRIRNHAIFTTFIFTGLRRTELLKLKYTDVDFEGLSIFVRQGKGNKDRIIPLSYQLAETLKKYLTERKRLKKTCPEFFTSLLKNKGLSEAGIKHIVNKLKKASGIKFGLH